MPLMHPKCTTVLDPVKSCYGLLVVTRAAMYAPPEGMWCRYSANILADRADRSEVQRTVEIMEICTASPVRALLHSRFPEVITELRTP